MTELDSIFGGVKGLLQSFEPQSFTTRTEPSGGFSLYSVKDMVVYGKKMSELYLAGVAKRKNSVVFYYMPLYGAPELGERLSPSLMKCLKGKTCFHLTKWDAEVEMSVKQALEVGLAVYRKMGWAN